MLTHEHASTYAHAHTVKDLMQLSQALWLILQVHTHTQMNIHTQSQRSDASLTGSLTRTASTHTHTCRHLCTCTHSQRSDTTLSGSLIHTTSTRTHMSMQANMYMHTPSQRHIVMYYRIWLYSFQIASDAVTHTQSVLLSQVVTSAATLAGSLTCTSSTHTHTSLQAPMYMHTVKDLTQLSLALWLVLQVHTHEHVCTYAHAHTIKDLTQLLLALWLILQAHTHMNIHTELKIWRNSRWLSDSYCKYTHIWTWTHRIEDLMQLSVALWLILQVHAHTWACRQICTCTHQVKGTS